MSATATVVPHIAKVSALSTMAVSPTLGFTATRLMPQVAGSAKTLINFARTSTALRTIENVSGAMRTFASVYGPIKQAQDVARAEKYNEAVLLANAQASRYAGKFRAYVTRREAEKLMGRQKALYAKAGVLLEGSPLEVMEESLTNMEVNALMEEYNAETQARRYESEAGYRSVIAREVRRSGYTEAGRSLLSVASDWAQRYWRV